MKELLYSCLYIYLINALVAGSWDIADWRASIRIGSIFAIFLLGILRLLLLWRKL
jgi:hypothetical protein